MDRARLAKLMAMTTSDHDPEALAALRMANAMLVKEKLTWAEVLAPGTVVNIGLGRNNFRAPATDEDWVPPHLQDKPVIEMMFRAVYAQPRSDNEEFWQFMDSIHHRWETYGNLSQGQYNGLRNSYKRCVRAK